MRKGARNSASLGSGVLAWMPTEGEPANHMAIDTITLSVVDSILPLDFKVIPISRGSTHAPSTLADLWT